MSNQIVYVAIGPDYLRMALRSAASALANGFPGGTPPGIVIVTDQPAAPPAGVTFIAVATPTGKYGSREYKTRFLDFASADQVLFLDCDTLVTGDISSLFRAAGIAMATHVFALPVLAKLPDFAATQAACGSAQTFNTGVIAIGNDAPGKSLCGGGGAWHAEWSRPEFGRQDVLAMLRALRSGGIAAAVLDPRFNDMGCPPKTGVIRHYHGGQKASGDYAHG